MSKKKKRPKTKAETIAYRRFILHSDVEGKPTICDDFSMPIASDVAVDEPKASNVKAKKPTAWRSIVLFFKRQQWWIAIVLSVVITFVSWLVIKISSLEKDVAVINVRLEYIQEDIDDMSLAQSEKENCEQEIESIRREINESLAPSIDLVNKRIDSLEKYVALLADGNS